MIGIIITIVGVAILVNGVLIILRIIKTSEDDTVTQHYAGIKGVVAGLLAIFLGLILYFTG